jgi:hypothetical protein
MSMFFYIKNVGTSASVVVYCTDDPQLMQFQSYTVKTNNNILEVHAKCYLVGKKAR